MFGKIDITSSSHYRNSEELTEYDIATAFLKAEKKGISEVILPKDNTSLKEDSIGQIMHWKSEENDDFHGPKKVWCLSGIIPDTWEPIESGGKSLREHGKLIFKILENQDYLPKKKIIMTEREVRLDLESQTLGLFAYGKFIIDKDGSYGRIKSIEIREGDDKDLMYGNEKFNPHRIDIPGDFAVIIIEEENNERISDISNPKFDRESCESIEDFLKCWKIIEEETLSEFESRVNLIEETGMIPQFGDVLAIEDGSSESTARVETNKALVGTNSKEHLENVVKAMDKRKNGAEVISRKMSRSVILMKENVMEILRKKEESLANVRESLNSAIAVFKKEMEKIEKLILTLEIYMGVNEDILQIREGQPAKLEEPIHFRQMQLFMDEEFGDTKNGGLDFQRLEDFDKWLSEDNTRFEKLVPEEKCVVIMRPRRFMKDRRHTGLAFNIIKEMEDADKRFYVLIRNGENLYRIWTRNIDLQNRLFPKRIELQTMMDELYKLEIERNKTTRESDFKRITEKIEDVEGGVFNYKKNMLLLQGLVVRTQVFAPIPEQLNVLDIRTHSNPDGSPRIVFIYDEEMTLQDGRPSYNEWRTEACKRVKKGSRIVVAVNGYSKYSDDRFSIKWEHDHSAPPMPPHGVYELKEYSETKQRRVTEWIPHEKWLEIEKGYKLEKKKNSRFKPKYFETGHMKLVNPLGSEHGLASEYKKEAVEVYQKDENGWEIKEDYIEKTLRISYNPKDTVYAGRVAFDDGSYSRERRTNITFIVYPEKDNFVINYDTLLKNDIDYYLGDRVQRVNYLEMMPILMELRDKLEAEAKEEQLFVLNLCSRLHLELKDFNLSLEQIEERVWKSVGWYKNDLARVWKRPLSKDEAKAWQLIQQEAKRLIRNDFKLKSLDTGVDNRKKTLLFKHESRSYIVTGVHKKQFYEALLVILEQHIWEGKIGMLNKASIERGILTTERIEIVELANRQKDKNACITKIDSDNKILMFYNLEGL